MKLLGIGKCVELWFRAEMGSRGWERRSCGGVWRMDESEVKEVEK